MIAKRIAIMLIALMFVFSNAHASVNDLIVTFGPQIAMQWLGKEDPKIAGMLPFLINPDGALLDLGLKEFGKKHPSDAKNLNSILQAKGAIENPSSFAQGEIIKKLQEDGSLKPEDAKRISNLQQLYGAASLLMEPDSKGNFGSALVGHEGDIRLRDSTGRDMMYFSDGTSIEAKKGERGLAGTFPAENGRFEINNVQLPESGRNIGVKKTGFAVDDISRDMADANNVDNSLSLSNDPGKDSETKFNFIEQEKSAVLTCHGKCNLDIGNAAAGIRGEKLSSLKIEFDVIDVEGKKEYRPKKIDGVASEKTEIRLGAKNLHLEKGDSFKYNADGGKESIEIDAKSDAGCLEANGDKICGKLIAVMDNGELVRTRLGRNSFYEDDNQGMPLRITSDDDELDILNNAMCSGNANCVSISSEGITAVGNVDISGFGIEGGRYSIKIKNSGISSWDLKGAPSSLVLGAGNRHIECSNGLCRFGIGQKTFGVLGDKEILETGIKGIPMPRKISSEIEQKKLEENIGKLERVVELSRELESLEMEKQEQNLIEDPVRIVEDEILNAKANEVRKELAILSDEIVDEMDSLDFETDYLAAMRSIAYLGSEESKEQGAYYNILKDVHARSVTSDLGLPMKYVSMESSRTSCQDSGKEGCYNLVLNNLLDISKNQDMKDNEEFYLYEIYYESLIRSLEESIKTEKETSVIERASDTNRLVGLFTGSTKERMILSQARLDDAKIKMQLIKDTKTAMSENGWTFSDVIEWKTDGIKKDDTDYAKKGQIVSNLYYNIPEKGMISDDDVKLLFPSGLMYDIGKVVSPADILPIGSAKLLSGIRGLKKWIVPTKGASALRSLGNADNAMLALSSKTGKTAGKLPTFTQFRALARNNLNANDGVIKLTKKEAELLGKKQLSSLDDAEAYGAAFDAAGEAEKMTHNLEKAVKHLKGRDESYSMIVEQDDIINLVLGGTSLERKQELSKVASGIIPSDSKQGIVLRRNGDGIGVYDKKDAYGLLRGEGKNKAVIILEKDFIRDGIDIALGPDTDINKLIRLGRGQSTVYKGKIPESVVKRLSELERDQRYLLKGTSTNMLGHDDAKKIAAIVVPRGERAKTLAKIYPGKVFDPFGVMIKP